jgi:hypothetical protein
VDILDAGLYGTCMGCAIFEIDTAVELGDRTPILFIKEMIPRVSIGKPLPWLRKPVTRFRHGIGVVSDMMLAI